MSVDNHVFHQVKIAGMTFRGIVSGDGPFLSCLHNGGVALGVSGLREFQPAFGMLHHGSPFGWWVVKHRDEERIYLPNFGRGAVRQLSDEFGLVILNGRYPPPSDRVGQDYFFTSPAWDALRTWVTCHPYLAERQAECDLHLPGWHRRAMVEFAALSGQR